ncbi:hypothetical protein F4775DRAFT_593988 [Biscogniauxia sp. FL1348]|nr:hypothetical protein F4775DRAFT_593988 [Biscogniauxia sp. FL1348]
MNSRYPQHRQLEGSNELSRAPARRLTQSPRESMLAYDSHKQRDVMATASPMYHRVDPTQAPGLESGRKKLGGSQRDESSSSNRWFGRSHKPKTQSVDKGKFSLDKLSISAPIPIGPAPTRPPRPPIEQTPASFYNFLALEELNGNEKPLPKPPQPPVHYPKQPSSMKPPTIRADRLGQRHDALGSHPVTLQLEGMSKRQPASHISSLSAKKQRNRNTVICPSGEEHHGMFREPQLSAGLIAERRRGRVYTPSKLQGFPDPTLWQRNEDEIDDQKYDQEYVSDQEFYDDRTWEEEERREEDPEIHGPNVPTINLVKPEDEPPQQTYLKVDNAWKNLYNNERKVVRGLERLAPLARMIAESENVDVNNAWELQDGLETIIQDRERLFKLWPLVEKLSEDQGLNVLDFNSMAPALESVFADRDRAKHMASVHKHACQQLEHQVRKLQGEVASMRATYYREENDDEDYIR